MIFSGYFERFLPRGARYYLLLAAERALRLRASVRAMLSITAFRKAQSEIVKRYCAANRKSLRHSGAGGGGIVIMDYFPIPIWIIANSIFVSLFARKTNASIASFGQTRRDVHSDMLYRSFGCDRHLQVSLTGSQEARRKRLFRSLLDTIQSKQDIFELKIDGISIGVDIYESILKAGVPTVDVNSLDTWYRILTGLRYYVYFADFFAANKVRAVVLSHDCYIEMGIISKIAYSSKVPVYFPNIFQLYKTERPNQIYANFRDFPSYFRRLDPAERQAAVESAKAALQNRLGGEVGVNMAYQLKSAFTNDRLPRQTRASDKTKVVIATHCFFDNPHCYGGMIFLDFHEWLSFLGKIAEVTDYDWYIKPHRDYLPGTMEALAKITAKYPKLRVINPDTTFHQLKEEGVSVALTCYGSIGHELPLLGIKVINAGYNPHIGYDFNWHASTKEEYSRLLLNLDQLGEIRDVEKIYEYYHVKNVLTFSESFLFDSYEKFFSYTRRDQNSVLAYEYYLLDEDTFRTKYTQVVETFLSKDSTYSFE